MGTRNAGAAEQIIVGGLAQEFAGTPFAFSSGFTGREFRVETGLYDYPARSRDVGTGLLSGDEPVRRVST